MARKPTIADVLGFGAVPKRDLTQGLRRAVARPTVATGSLKPAYRTVSQRIAEVVTPNTKGGVKAARQIQGILDFVTALGTEEDLVQSQGAFQRGDYGDAAKFGILAALGAIPGGKGAGTAARSTVRDFSNIAFDPALYGLRKTKDLPRLQASPATYQRTSASPQAQSVSIADYIGRPYIISMADRTAAGDLLTRIGNVDLNFPVSLQGGQDFMFNPTTGGLVWASEKSPVSNIMNLAGKLYEKTGQKPIYLPYRMAGSGSDFATMTGETMMAYADAVLDANGQINGANLQAVISNLGDLGGTLMKSADAFERRLGVGVSKLRGSFIDNLAKQNPAQAKALKNLNTGWAQEVRLQKATAGAGGVLTPQSLDRAVASFAKGQRQGPLADLARAGRIIPSRLPDSGTAGRMLRNSAILGAVGSLGAVGNEIAQNFGYEGVDISPSQLSAIALIAAPYTPAGRKAIAKILGRTPSKPAQMLGTAWRGAVSPATSSALISQPEQGLGNRPSMLTPEQQALVNIYAGGK